MFAFARHLLTTVTLCLSLGLLSSAASAQAPAWDPQRTTSPDNLAELKSLQDTVKKVVEKVTPATVAVLMPAGDSWSVGSGVIVSADGLVMTAAHVISDPESRSRRRGNSTLILSDGRRVQAQPLGRNADADSGMLRITTPAPKGGWPFAEVGDSSATHTGQWVLLMGHPGGPRLDDNMPQPHLIRKPVVRVGQLLGIHHESDDPDYLRTRRSKDKEKDATKADVTYLISDCTIVGGDSGGPLFDLNGKVIGIHSQIRKSLTKNLHVPSKSFKDEWKRLVRGDYINEAPAAVMGVELNWQGDKEPTIKSLVDNGPASQAGVQAGDRILKFNGEAIKTSEDIEQIMSSCSPGQVVTLELKRGDEIVEAKVKLTRRAARQQ